MAKSLESWVKTKPLKAGCTIFAGCVVAAFVLTAIGGYFIVNTPPPTAAELEERRIERAAEDRAEAIQGAERHFSAWDGHHRHLVRYVKRHMHDPGSFEHIETRWTVLEGNERMWVRMEYRGRNAYGALVRQVVIAECSVETGEVLLVY